MGMFQKSKPAPTKAPMAREKRGPAPRTPNNDAAISIIGEGMQVVGDLITEGTVRIEGRVEGKIRAGKAVVLGKGGEVRGEIETADAVIGGRLEGTITAQGRLEIEATSSIEGEVRARAAHLKLDEGASFNGQISMLEESRESGQRKPSEGSHGGKRRPRRPRPDDFHIRAEFSTIVHTTFPQSWITPPRRSLSRISSAFSTRG